MTSEAEWIQQARAGDQTAFGCLVAAYQTPVYNLTYRMLGDAAEAEDATQETFIRAYTHLHSYDPQRPFHSWLFSIASHYCIDRIRRRRAILLSFEDEIATADGGGGAGELDWKIAAPHPESVVARREHEAWIQRMLATLSPLDRAAITFRYWYDYSYEEIADALNLTVSAVKSRLHRARCEMGRLIEQSQAGDDGM